MKPEAGKMFTIGDNIISWEPPYDGLSHVKIDLYKGSDIRMCIDMFTDNTGEYIWTIDETDKYEDRCDYQIKITMIIDLETFGFSSQFCIGIPPEIVDKPEPLNITFIVIVIVLSVVGLIYYDRKTHKIRNWFKK